MFKILLSASKDSVFMKDPKEGGNLVSRWAGCDAYKEEYLQLLVEHYPEVVRIPNNDESYPLHLASQNRSTKNVSLLLNSFREAVHIRDLNNWLPLDYAAAFSTVKVFKLLYDM
jgi:ankyrin repeat protein